MSNLLYQHVLSKFPSKYIKFAFAYGSGVFEQLENKPKLASTMVDFVFVVDDSIRFHDENLTLNYSHYSALKHLGPYYLTRIQNDFGAACYYNTLVPLKIEDTTFLIKYGVISEEALIRDLYDWDYLYMSGRLHKPVKIIKRTSKTQSDPTLKFNTINQTSNIINKEEEEAALNSESFTFESFNKSVDMALQTNLRNALHTALLLLPESFTLEELFLCITQLSYSGDLRMIVGENKQKCFNIVRPQMDRFTDLYKPYLIKESFEKYLECNFESGKMNQYLNQATIYHHLNQLPKNLMLNIINSKFRRTHHYDLEEYIFKLANRIDYKEVIGEAVSAIVKYSSTVQSLKGVLTAGMLKTVNYSMRKLNKMFKN